MYTSELEISAQHCCQQMADRLVDGETAIRYVLKFRESGIPVLDGGESFIIIQFCPWCGNRLPESLRSEWFDRLEQMGLELDNPETPAAAMRTAEWWRSNGR